MSLLRAFLLAQAIAATTKKHFKTSLSTLMDNAMQEDQALLKDKKEGDNNSNNSNNNNKGTRSEVTLNPVELMQSNVWSTFRSVASKNQCYDEMPNVLFRTEAAKAQLKGKMFFLCLYFSLLSMGRSKIGTRSIQILTIFPFVVHLIEKITMPCLKHPCI
jgi:hypothetical protein